MESRKLEVAKMRFEGKTEEEALGAASRKLATPVEDLKYRVIRDEKSFWGSRIVEIEIDVEVEERTESREADVGSSGTDPLPAPDRAAVPAGEGLDPEAFAAVEATLSELLSAAGLLVEIRRQPSSEEMVFELIGDDVEPLLASRGEGLNGLEVLTGRIAGKRLGRPVHPRLDAEGFRAHQKESLQELAFKSAEEAKRTRRPQLLPPLSPAERRLVHLALAQDPEVTTESEGEGFLKRVAVRVKS